MKKRRVLRMMVDAIKEIEKAVEEAKANNDTETLYTLYERRDDMYDDTRRYAKENGLYLAL